MKPSLADQDLRDYFWLARDRTGSTFTGVVFVSPAVQAALQNLLSENTGEQTIGLSAAQKLAADDLTHLIKLLRQDAERRTEENAAPKALHLMAVNGIRDAAKALIEVAGVISPAKLRPSIPQNIAEIAKHDGGFLPSVTEVLTGINEHSSTAAGRAAKSALATLAKKKG